MIPVHDVIPIRTRPVMTYALLAALGVLAVAPWAQELPWPGATDVDTVSPGVMLARTLAHRDWVHVTSNVLALWLFGPAIENLTGRGRYLVLTLACAGAGAAAAMSLHAPPVAYAGWSGLAAGLVASYTMQFPKSRAVVPVPVLVGFELTDVPIWAASAFWTSVQLVDMVPPRAIAAGAVAGALGLAIARRPERLKPDWWSPMGEGRRQARGARR